MNQNSDYTKDEKWFYWEYLIRTNKINNDVT